MIYDDDTDGGGGGGGNSDSNNNNNKTKPPLPSQHSTPAVALRPLYMLHSIEQP